MPACVGGPRDRHAPHGGCHRRARRTIARAHSRADAATGRPAGRWWQQGLSDATADS